jgi:hypothetical protein
MAKLTEQVVNLSPGPPGDARGSGLALAGERVANTNVTVSVSLGHVPFASTDPPPKAEQPDGGLTLAGGKVIETSVVCDPHPSLGTLIKVGTVSITTGAIGTVLGKTCFDILQDHPDYLHLVNKLRVLVSWLLQ